MKIGILVWDLSIRGGTQRQALELALYLKRNNINVIVYSYILDKTKCYDNLIDQLDIKSVQSGQRALEDSNFLKLRKAFSDSIEEYRAFVSLIDRDINILNPHDQKVYIVANLYKSRYTTSVVWNMNDIPYKGGSLNRFEKCLKRLSGIEYLLNLRTRRIIENFEKIVVLDNMNRDAVRSIFKIDAEIVRSGLDINGFKFNEKDIDKANIKLFSNGVIYEHRRIEDTIIAVGILRKRGYNVSFNYAGSEKYAGSYKEKLIKLIHKQRLNDYVTFHGSVVENDLMDLYRSSDIFVFPNYPQTWGLAVFEAMALGLPTVITKGCGASEILSSRENSMIVDVHSPSQIANAVVDLVENKELKDRISSQGRQFVEKNISWELFGRDMLRIMESLKQTRPA